MDFDMTESEKIIFELGDRTIQKFVFKIKIVFKSKQKKYGNSYLNSAQTKYGIVTGRMDIYFNNGMIWRDFELIWREVAYFNTSTRATKSYLLLQQHLKIYEYLADLLNNSAYLLENEIHNRLETFKKDILTFEFEIDL